MNARLFRAKRRGQSIPLIALIIVVLFAMVGLSVDVGNTYAVNRNAVRATNAATLAAMDKVIKNGTDTDVGRVIVASFKSNGIDPQIREDQPLAPGQLRVRAYYLDSNGNRMYGCEIGSCGDSLTPTNVQYIQIRTEGTVDTYFARVVGRQTLPVKAQAFAAQCTPVNGVYPIAINSSDLDENGFIPPIDPDEKPYYGIYRDEQYPDGWPQRRIYTKANFGSPGSFSWLLWKNDPGAGSARNLENMVSGDGSLDTGFTEVVIDPPLTRDYVHKTGWPDPSSPEVEGYPLYPGQLTEGDWIYGNTGATVSNDVYAALDYHIANRTVLNLPIVDKVVGQGQNTYLHFQRMGAFYMVAYNRQGGGNMWYDLVYIGASSKTACLHTNINLGMQGLGITGQAFLNPRWQLSQPRQPIAYQIVLDVSGSMSWDFAGHGTVGGTNYQCEMNIPGDPLPYYGDSNGAEACPPPFDWHNVQERRVYIAKNAIFNFINKMDANDTMRVIIYTSTTGNPPRGTASSPAGWSGDKATLINTVRNAGARNGDPWATAGGTPAPQGLQEARRLLLASNGFPSQAPNGQPYKPVVIFFTDGVANFFLNGNVNTARDVCGNMTISVAYTTPYPCQVGYTSSNMARPITAMIEQANGMKTDNPALSLYVIGLGNVPETGLDRVASDPSMFYLATQPNLVDDILTKINALVEGSACTPTGGFQWIDSIDAAHTPGNPPFNLPSGTFGYVYIYEPNGGIPKFTLPIQHDPVSGKLSFSIPPPDPANPSSTGITPGTYEMEAYLGYKGNDGTSRQYDWFINQNNLKGSSRITFAVTSAATIGRSVALDPIFLDLKQAASVCPTGP